MSTAELGFVIDSSPAAKAAVDLDALTAAAKKVDAAATEMGQSVTGASHEAGAAASELGRQIVDVVEGANRAVEATKTIGPTITPAFNAANESLKTFGSRITLTAQQINSSLNVRDSFGGANRGADIEAYGKSLDDLRAKYNPVFAAQRDYQKMSDEITQAVKVGAITQDEANAALTRASTVATASAHAHAGLSTQAMAAQHSIRGFTEMMIQGVPVTQALAMETNNLVYAMSHPRGLLAAMKEGISVFAGLINPAVLIGVAIAGTAGAAILAAHQWSSAQKEIDLALSGTGRAAGLMREDINRIGAESASSFGLSVSEATKFATALAATGKIGKDNIESLVKIGKDLATLYGGDVTKAAELTAKAFADPAKGADVLNERLGFLDAATRRNIQNLTEQNRLYEAQKLLAAGVANSLGTMRTQLDSSASFWTALGNGISNAWTALGAFLSRSTGIGYTAGIGEQIENTRKEIEELQRTMESLRSQPSWFNSSSMNQSSQLKDLQDALDKAKQKYSDLQRQSDEYWRSVAEAQERQKSLAFAGAVGAQLPEIAELDRLKNQLDLLSSAMINVQMTGGAASPLLKLLGLTFQQLAKAVEEARGKVAGFLSESDRAIQGLKVQIDAVGRRSPAALGDIAYRQTLNSLGSDSATAKQQAELARTLAVKQAQQSILDTQRQQYLTAQQRADSARLELQITGASSVEQERQRAILQAKQQLEQEALQTYGSRDAYDRKHLAALTEQINKEAALKQTLAEQNALRDAKFAGQQINRTADEQQVASTLRGIYGDDYQKYMNGNIAATIRFNQQMQFAHDTFVGFGQDLRSNLQQGMKFWDAFGKAGANALDKIIQKLTDMALNDLWNAAFPSGGNGAGGGFMSWITSFFSGAGHNAGGTDNWRGGLTWVGEKGPELVNLPSGAQVIPNNKLGSVMGAVANGNISIQVNNAPPGTSATATASRGPNGDASIAITLRRTQDANNADLLASGESATNRALEQRYGLVPRL